MVSACEGDSILAEKILWGNANRFFGLDKIMSAHGAASEPFTL